MYVIFRCVLNITVECDVARGTVKAGTCTEEEKMAWESEQGNENEWEIDKNEKKGAREGASGGGGGGDGERDKCAHGKQLHV